MKWSWKLVRLAGVDIYIHATFLILIAWIGFVYWQAEGTLIAVISGIGFILSLFACVVLHELGHSLVARHYGIRTEHITLLPIGGVAALERLPDDPKQEIHVALAGPAVNVVIALVLWILLSLQAGFSVADELDVVGGTFLERLLVVNLILAIFNMLPALPMDGGRVLRAALAMRMSHAEATRIAAKIGQAFALVLGFLGLAYNPFLAFIALFVWIGAGAEAQWEKMKSALSGVRLGQAMLTEYRTLSPQEPLRSAIELTLATSQKDFPVLADGNIIGVLTQTDLLRGLHAEGDAVQCGDWMQPGVERADADEPVEKVLERLQSGKCRLVSVTRGDRLVGIVDMDNVVELIRIRDAVQEHEHEVSMGV